MRLWPDEIMADKLVSLTVAEQVRHRDIWDLAWLQQQGAGIRPDLVVSKINDYRVTGYLALVDNMIGQCSSIIEGGPFKNQMRRFLPADIQKQTLDKARYSEALAGAITGLYTELQRRLLDDTDDNDGGGSPSAIASV